MDISKLHRYSKGIVIEDNLTNESDIKIFPIEKMYYLGGDLNKPDKVEATITSKSLDIDPEALTAKYKDSKEVLKLDSTKYIIATWLNSNTNQITPPNVCKGEVVTLYRYSNRDEYYWVVEDIDLSLRKKEHVVYSYSAKDKLDEAEDILEDRYNLTISPRDGLIMLHTTDKYGELTTYDFELNTIAGNLSIKDGKGNNIVLDSSSDTLSIDIVGKKAEYNVTVAADEGTLSITDNKSNNIVIDSNSDKITITTNSDIEFNTSNYTVNCSTYTVNSETANFNASSYTLDSSNVEVKSSLTTYTGGIIKHDGIPIGKTSKHLGNLGIPTSPPIT